MHAQSTVEYAMVIGALVLAFIGMQAYMGGAMRANLKGLELEANALTKAPEEIACNPGEVSEGGGCIIGFVCPAYSCPPVPRCCAGLTCVATSPPTPHGTGGRCSR